MDITCESHEREPDEFELDVLGSCFGVDGVFMDV